MQELSCQGLTRSRVEKGPPGLKVVQETVAELGRVTVETLSTVRGPQCIHPHLIPQELGQILVRLPTHFTPDIKLEAIDSQSGG